MKAFLALLPFLTVIYFLKIPMWIVIFYSIILVFAGINMILTIFISIVMNWKKLMKIIGNKTRDNTNSHNCNLRGVNPFFTRGML